MAAINSLYLLTPMTGRTSGSERTMIVATFEMKWRSFWIAMIALVPGAMLTGLFHPMIGIWALLWIVLTEALAFYAIERRSKDGLQLRTYQSMLDKRKSNLNTFYLCGAPIAVAGSSFGVIQKVTAQVHRDEPTSDLSDLFDPKFEA